MIKIPLTCILTTERMSVPARGIFCQHFQCFDLHNFVFMVAQAANPRWVCPLCRLPAYHLRVDCILSAILAEHSEEERLSEVLFFRGGEYTIANERELSEDCKRSIHDLSISSMRKRSGESGSERSGRALGRKEVVIDLSEE
jgi:hypothetical protein